MTDTRYFYIYENQRWTPLSGQWPTMLSSAADQVGVVAGGSYRSALLVLRSLSGQVSDGEGLLWPAGYVRFPPRVLQSGD